MPSFAEASAKARIVTALLRARATGYCCVTDLPDVRRVRGWGRHDTTGIELCLLCRSWCHLTATPPTVFPGPVATLALCHRADAASEHAGFGVPVDGREPVMGKVGKR
ncbi:hypothetical protein, partial [Micromonospora carbonacea]|uniref:hypothetical protein n=1 Tax=Micromonospora carbonacea TaxID=47853 RepID=UPI00371D9FCE